MRSRIILFSIIFLLVGMTICTSDIMPYFGRIDTELKVKQPITIDGNTADQPITHKLEVLGGASVEVKHKIENKGEIDANISQYSTGLTEGIELIITYKNGTVVTFPFVLEGKDKVTLVFTYITDMNLMDGTYFIQTYFMCEKI